MTKYVTQGEREMVEAVVGAALVCECPDTIAEVGGTGIYLGRPAMDANGLLIWRLSATSRPVVIESQADGSSAGRGVDFATDDVLERGQRVATRVWVHDQLPEGTIATQDWVEAKLPSVASDWLVASDTVVGSVLFENVGEREFEYQPRDGVQVTFYPRTSSQDLPMPWSVIQQRIVGYGTTGPKIQVRCIADDGTKTPFVAVVTDVAP